MQVRLIIPNVSDDTQIALYEEAIADIAGGFTSWQGVGGWKDENGDLIVEYVTVVDTSLQGGDCMPTSLALSDLRYLAKRIARELNQKSVYLSIDGKVEYVKP